MKKRLLFTSYNLDIGGIEKSLVNLLNNINYNKYDVTLILEKKEGLLLKNVNKNVKIKEVKVSKCKFILLRKLINYFRKELFKIKYKNYYDFSCCYATYSLSSNKLALIGSSNSSIYVHSNYKDLYNEDEYLNFFNSRNIKKFNKIIFVSNESRRDFVKIYDDLKDKTYVFNNFIDVDDILKKSKEVITLKKDDTKKLFVFIGRLDDSSKKLTRAINIVKNIKNIILWVIGDGPDKEKYEDIVKQYDLTDRVIFLGAKQNPYCYLDKADYFILTSEYEGFPVTFLEAITLNKMIISTINVSDELINIGKDYGYIISKDESEMIKEVKQILKEKNKKKEINIKEIQHKRMEKLEKLFDEVI